MATPTTERLVEVLSPIIETFKVELVDLEYSGSILRITVEREGGLDLSVISRLTRQISNYLDESDPIDGRYTLEVSSPGLERALRTPEHFIKAVGRTVNIKVDASVGGERRFRAVLMAADLDGITVQQLDVKELVDRRLSYDDVVQCKTIFEWQAEPKPSIKQAVPTGAKASAKKSISPSASAAKRVARTTTVTDKGDSNEP